MLLLKGWRIGQHFSIQIHGTMAAKTRLSFPLAVIAITAYLLNFVSRYWSFAHGYVSGYVDAQETSSVTGSCSAEVFTCHLFNTFLWCSLVVYCVPQLHYLRSFVPKVPVTGQAQRRKQRQEAQER